VRYHEDQYLGLQMFTIYINDLDVGTKCNISKSACDGLPAEFHLALWEWIGPDLLGVYESMLLEDSVSESMRKGIISLIYKQKGEREEIRNWPPISLLNVDNKILAKVIANRVKSALESVIHPDQTCAVPVETGPSAQLVHAAQYLPLS